MSFPEIQAITQARRDRQQARAREHGHAYFYLRFNLEMARAPRDQIPSVIDSIRKRMGALHKKNQLSFT